MGRQGRNVWRIRRWPQPWARHLPRRTGKGHCRVGGVNPWPSISSRLPQFDGRYPRSNDYSHSLVSRNLRKAFSGGYKEARYAGRHACYDSLTAGQPTSKELPDGCFVRRWALRSSCRGLLRSVNAQRFRSNMETMEDGAFMLWRSMPGQ